MKMQRILLTAFLCAVAWGTLYAISGCRHTVEAQPPVVRTLGWLEKVRLYPSDILLHAKLDTGADSCSVHAENIELLAKNEEDWIQFDLINRYGSRERLERKIVRFAKVKTKKRGFQTRPVVRLGVCVADHYEIVECNLVDRSHFSSPVLIGRNVLAGAILVNSSETYTAAPECHHAKDRT